MDELENGLNPPFPANRHGLQNGSRLIARHPDCVMRGLAMGRKFPIGWTGARVRYRDCCWNSVEQLCAEIDAGIWSIAEDRVDFDNYNQWVVYRYSCT